MYPAGQIAQAMAEGIGTGLYRVECFKPGQRFIGRRVQNHYRDGQAGWFDEVDFTALESLAARRTAAFGHDGRPSGVFVMDRAARRGGAAGRRDQKPER